jgi:hypothetical protein
VTRPETTWNGWTISCNILIWTSPDCDNTVIGLSPAYDVNAQGKYDDDWYFNDAHYRLWKNKLQPGDHWTDMTIKSFNVTCWKANVRDRKIIWPSEEELEKEKGKGKGKGKREESKR